MFNIVFPTQAILRAAFLQGFAAGAICVLLLIILALLLRDSK